MNKGCARHAKGLANMQKSKTKSLVVATLPFMLLCLSGCYNVTDNSISKNNNRTVTEQPEKVEDNNSYRSYSVARNPTGQPVKSSDGFEYSMFDTRQVNKGSCSSTKHSSKSNPYEDGYEEGYEEGYQDAQRDFELN